MAEKRPKWIALFRGINVGGKHIVPMKALRELATEIGFDEPKTYIQSGNMVFGSPEENVAKLEEVLADAVEKRFGFRPFILMRRVADIKHALDDNPFAKQVTEGKQCHIYFLEGEDGKYDEAALKELATGTEQFALKSGLFYLYAPDGVGQSKLAEKLPKYLPKRYTARNLNSVQAVLAMAD